MDKKVNDALRAQYVALISELLAGKDEQVLRTGSGEIALPVVDSSGEDNWVVVTVKIPTGSRDGDAYDGFSMEEDYKLKLADKAEKAKKAAEQKAKKIERDKKMREQKAAQKEKRA